MKIKRAFFALLSALLVLQLFSFSLSAATNACTTVSTTVYFEQSSVRKTLDSLNSFRTGSDAWYWNSSNTAKITITGLSALTYDYELEKIAMQRCAEIAIRYSHERPNGKSCFSAYTFDYGAVGENIAVGYTTAQSVYNAWKEDSEQYSGQGHRRNMLSSNYSSFAAAHVKLNGCDYWVQEFCDRKIDTVYKAPANEYRTVSIDIMDNLVTVKSLSSSSKSISLSLCTGSIDIPKVNAVINVNGLWSYSTDTVSVVPNSTYSIADTGICTVSQGKLFPKKAGQTSLEIKAFGKVVTVPITVTAHNYQKTSTEAATCLNPATITYKCTNCTNSYTKSSGSALGHSFGEWTLTKQPTSTTTGLKVRTCIRCPQTEEEVIPKAGTDEAVSLSVNNYTVSITGANEISVIRYALGEYNTASDIKKASGCITLNLSIIQASTVNGVFNRTMTSEGIYSFYVKLTNGKEYILKAELTHFTQELSSKDNYLTVSNLFGVSDIFFCEGHFDTYDEVKSNHKFRATRTKIDGANHYTYAMTGAGNVTVYVKYTDSSREPEFYYTVLTTPNPSITKNGLSITINDLANVKCIKRVFGTYTTPTQVKSASGVVTYSASVTNGSDSAIIQLPYEGALTVMIQYKSGYTVVKNVKIEQKKPSFIQNGNKVTISKLDDLYVVRYAKGTYTKANAVKAASGSKCLRLSDSVNGQIVIRHLEQGTYTFLVQYNEQSQNLYTITVP